MQLHPACPLFLITEVDKYKPQFMIVNHSPRNTAWTLIAEKYEQRLITDGLTQSEPYHRPVKTSGNPSTL